MRKFNLFIIALVIPSLAYAGFNIGTPSAVKRKVDDLNKRVEEKELADSDDTSTQDDTDNTSQERWVDADGSGQESMNISNTSEESFSPSFCIDNENNPHIAWYDNELGNYEIFYLRWDGTAWVDADGSGQESINISHTSASSMDPSLSIDNSGNPHIAWYDNELGNYEIFYLKWNGTAWVDADGSGQESINISNTSRGAISPSLDIDTAGNPHIAWSHNETGNMDISYLAWNGTAWVDADGSGQESIRISDSKSFMASPSLCLDNADNPHVAWIYPVPGTNEVFYIEWDGSNWVDADGSGQESINISNIYSASSGPSLCLDNDGNPHIAWYQLWGYSYIYYLRWNGALWVDADGFGRESISITNTSRSANRPSLDIDSGGNPHIAWCDDISMGNFEIYYLKWK